MKNKYRIVYLLLREHFCRIMLSTYLDKLSQPGCPQLKEKNISLKSSCKSNHFFFTLKLLQARYFFLLHLTLVLGVSMIFNALCLRQSQNDMQVNNLISPESYLTQNQSPISLFIVNINRTNVIEITHMSVLQYWNVTFLHIFSAFSL